MGGDLQVFSGESRCVKGFVPQRYCPPNGSYRFGFPLLTSPVLMLNRLALGANPLKTWSQSIKPTRRRWVNEKSAGERNDVLRTDRLKFSAHRREIEGVKLYRSRLIVLPSARAA